MARTLVRRLRLRPLSALFLLISWLLVPPAFAQTPAAPSVSGVVVDDVGRTIAGARVTVSNDNGALAQTATDASGAFVLQGLVPGHTRCSWR